MKRYIISEKNPNYGTYYVGHGHEVVYDLMDAKFFTTVEEAQKFVGHLEISSATIIEVDVTVDIKSPVLRIEPESEYE